MLPIGIRIDSNGVLGRNALRFIVVGLFATVFCPPPGEIKCNLLCMMLAVKRKSNIGQCRQNMWYGQVYFCTLDGTHILTGKYGRGMGFAIGWNPRSVRDAESAMQLVAHAMSTVATRIVE